SMSAKLEDALLALGADANGGGVTTAFDSPSDASISLATANKIYLVVRRADGADVVVVPDGRGVTLGPAPGSTTRLPDARVSRCQATIRRKSGTLVLEDHGSRNGTSINERRLKGGQARLWGGDVLRLGGIEIVVAVACGPQESSVANDPERGGPHGELG